MSTMKTEQVVAKIEGEASRAATEGAAVMRS
jgi:hypothetical protein